MFENFQMRPNSALNLGGSKSYTCIRLHSTYFELLGDLSHGCNTWHDMHLHLTFFVGKSVNLL